jgi:hypothetical protein
MSSSSTSVCTDDGLEEVMVSLVEKGLINDYQPSVDIFDLDYFRGWLRAARAAFSKPFVLNAMALKANSIRDVMKTAKEDGFWRRVGLHLGGSARALHGVQTRRHHFL